MSSSLVYDLACHRVGGVFVDLVAESDGWVSRVPVLTDDLAQLTDPRRRRGQRYDLLFLLLVLVMAVLAGATSISGVLRWAGTAPEGVLAVLARGGRTALPAHSTFSRLLSRLDGDELDDAFSRYTAALLAPGDLLPDPASVPDWLPAGHMPALEPVPAAESVPVMELSAAAVDSCPVVVSRDGGDCTAAPASPGACLDHRAPVRAWSLDGKSVRGAATATTRAPHLVSVLRHDTNTVAAQRNVDLKTNEITVFEEVLNVIGDLRGQVVIADALHTQRSHATYLHGRGAFYLFPVAENQPKLFEAVNAMAWQQAPVGFEEAGKGHGRSEKRITKVLPAPPGLPFPNAAQVILTERITTGRPGGKIQAVAALAITALPAHLAGPQDLAGHIRNHWKIEVNHHIRDTTYGEDASQVRTGSAPRIMASIRNQALNLAHIAGFTSTPDANDHYKARPDQALELLGLTI
jgi:predicted transposase YbfD/YdcC